MAAYSDSDQCAVSADGTLLDASDIVFYNDPDDYTPLPNSSSAATSTHLHPFFQGSPAPSKMVAGSRRSCRVTCPSARIADPNNLEASTATRKQSATVTTSTEGSLRAASRAKLTSSDDESEHENQLDNAVVDTGADDDVGTGDGTGDTTTEEEGVEDSTDVGIVNIVGHWGVCQFRQA